MKQILLPALLVSLSLCAPAYASPEFGDNVPRPIHDLLLKSEKTPRLSVPFSHKQHADVNCDTCHHRPRCAICHFSPREQFSPDASCSTAGCHPDMGNSREPMSRFMAFHKRDSERSCYGCHLKDGRTDGCMPCHGDKKTKSGK